MLRLLSFVIKIDRGQSVTFSSYPRGAPRSVESISLFVQDLNRILAGNEIYSSNNHFLDDSRWRNHFSTKNLFAISPPIHKPVASPLVHSSGKFLGEMQVSGC